MNCVGTSGCASAFVFDVLGSIVGPVDGGLVSSAIHNEYYQLIQFIMGNICQDQQVKSLEVVRFTDKDKLPKRTSNKRQSEQHIQDVPDSFQTNEPQSRPKKVKNLSEPAPSLNEHVKAALSKEREENPILGPHFGTFPVHYLAQKEAHYQGHWHNNQPHGQGAIFFKTGAYFQGQLVEGQVECSDGLLILADGSYYRGAFKNSVFQGTGSFLSASGTIYQGQWEAGVPHGKGKERFSDGNCYEGSFVNGKKEGQGVFRWDDGRVYEGEFKNGMMQGKGKFYIGDQQYFEGQFFENRKIGQGVKLKTTQGTYTGDFQNDIISGKFEWNDQTVYQGEFKNGRPHGQGTLIYPQGRILVGLWEEGRNIKIQDVKSHTRSRSRSRSRISQK